MDRDNLFREAVRAHDQMISRICSRFFGGGENARDAHQEILLKIWLNIDKFRNECSIKTWIYRIAVNVCLTSVTKVKKKSEIFLPVTKAVYQMSYRENLSGQDDENKILFFRRFMETLNTADRTLVTLYLEDLDTKQLAEVTGLSESNVRVKIHRIKNEIKNQWEKEYGT